MISLMNTRTFVNVGDEVIILCAAEGSPNDIDYIWYDSRIVLSDCVASMDYRNLTGTKMELKLALTRPEDGKPFILKRILHSQSKVNELLAHYKIANYPNPHISDVDSSKEGNYSCLSSNSIGTITSIHEIWLRSECDCTLKCRCNVIDAGSGSGFEIKE